MPAASSVPRSCRSSCIPEAIAQLSLSFNYLANQIEDNYNTLENKVNQRTLQIQTAAEVAQNVTAIPDLDLMLKKTAELLVQQFGFYQARIFLKDRSGRNIEFKSGYGSATRELAERNYSLPIGSQSIIGWVAENNQAPVASDVTEDPLHLKNELLPETRSEACVPIPLGDQVLGVLDVQSTLPGAFSADSILMLKTLASQVAAAVQTTSLIEASNVNFQELDRLYRSSRLIAEANDEAEVIQVGGLILKNSPYPVILFRVDEKTLKVLTASEMIREEIPLIWLSEGFSAEKQYRRNHNLWDVKEEDLPVFGTIASQFNDPGTNRLYADIISLLNTKTQSNFASTLEISNEMSEKIYIIPPARIRYLAEIAENNRAFDQWIGQQSSLASRLYAIRNTINILKEDAKVNIDVDRLEELYNQLESDLTGDSRRILAHWNTKFDQYKQNVFEYKVRDKVLAQTTCTLSLSNTRIAKVVLPKYRDWGDLLKWSLNENVPGEFPFTAGVFPFQREGEDPTRMFPGEGVPSARIGGFIIYL